MKKSVAIVCVILSLILIAGCANARSNADDTNNALDLNVAEALLIEYLEALRLGFAHAVDSVPVYHREEYIHLRELNYEESVEKLVDFVIEDSEKLNDDLYVFIVLLEFDRYTPEKYIRNFFFVGNVDEELYVMPHFAYNVPDELCVGLDASKYTYANGVDLFPGMPKEHNGKQIIYIGEPGEFRIVQDSDIIR